MIKTALLFSGLLFAFQVFSQVHFISGRVIDEETQQPLKGASVYINNTTKGVVTNENGEFELGPFAPGRYEVIASYVGYITLLYSAEIKAATVRISFRLAKKEEVLRPVLVLTDETRRRYLQIFKEYVLGSTAAAGKCKIKNIEEIQFAPGATKDDVSAYTEKELVIENPELGYTIYFELLDFNYNKQSSSTYFFGYTRYVDWGKDNHAKKKWLKKRKEVYEGSTMHFYRSLINKNLNADGFSVQQLIAMQKGKRDSGLNKGNIVLQQENKGMKMAVKTFEDSMIRLYSDSVYRIYELRIGDGWRINYAKNTALKNEILRKDGLILQPAKGTNSGLRLRQAPALLSDKGILYTPVNVYSDGMWSYERLANMLPEDYEPD